MPTNETTSISPPHDIVDVFETPEPSGDYVHECEMVRDGLHVLQVRDQAAVENWLRVQVGPAYDALKADPSRALSAEQVRASLAAEHVEV